MAKQKVDRTRLTLDLTENDIKRTEKLEAIYETTSRSEAVRIAIRHDLVLIQFIKAGNKIQLVKEDGTVETLVFTEWMPFM
jgi:metal-responsive CopG/Arc/MetJ family transcriptional regulator